MNFVKKNILLCLLSATFFSCKSQDSKYWKNFVKVSKGNGTTAVLPDFSYAGYHFGEKELPKNLNLKEFKVEDFGAIANDKLSDRKAIEKAIAAAEKAGSGVVLFGKGTYRVSEIKGLSSSIIVKNDNIILSGAGSQDGGTVLLMKEHFLPTDPTKKWTVPPMFKFKGKGKVKLVGKIAKPVRSGDFKIEFKESHGIKKGDIIGIFGEGIFLNKQFLKGKKTREKWTNINTKGAYVKEYHLVDRVLGNTIFFHAPILVNMEIDEPWEINIMNFIENCGFQDIRFVGNFHEPFVHHKNAYQDAGFKAVDLYYTYNSWARNCTFANVSRAVAISSSLCGTLYKNKLSGNGGHGSFGLVKNTRGLIAYCEDNAKQWHGPNASHGSVGSVILRFKGKSRGIDVHAAFPRITLFDECEIPGFDGERVGKASHGGNVTNLPNHLDGLVLWNFKQTALPRPDFNFWDLMEDTPDKKYGPLTAVDPIIVGFQGEGTSFVMKNVGIMESFGKAVTPGSLYLAQLKLRTNKIPNYLKRDED